MKAAWFEFSWEKGCGWGRRGPRYGIRTDPLHVYGEKGGNRGGSDGKRKARIREIMIKRKPGRRQKETKKSSDSRVANLLDCRGSESARTPRKKNALENVAPDRERGRLSKQCRAAKDAGKGCQVRAGLEPATTWI